MHRTKSRLTVVAVTALMATSACAANSGGGGSGPVVLGASLSLTGPLGTFGPLQQVGYEQAIKDVNDAGGLKIGGTSRTVALKVLDNRSDPNLAGAQARELILKDGATGLLGPCSTPMVIPVAQVADSQKVPLVTSCAPVGAFKDASQAGWKYSWDMFFSENDQAAKAAKIVGSAGSNKKVAVFTDTEPDGIAQRPLFIAAAEAAGLQVVGDYSFPPGTSDFSAFLNDSKGKGAEVVIAQILPPDGIALWKQMKGLGFSPKVAYITKAGATGGWTQALGPLANGTASDTFWSPEIGDAVSTKTIQSTLEPKVNNIADLSFAAFSYTVTNVMLDGISTAGSTDPGKINDAIGKTEKKYALGKIAFQNNVATTPLIITQWQAGGKAVYLDPPAQGAQLQVPVAGLS